MQALREPQWDTDLLNSGKVIWAIFVQPQLRTIEGHIDHYDHSGDQGVSQSTNPTISKVRSTLGCGRVRMRVRPSLPI